MTGVRVGTGYDVHRLVAGRRLLLGGVEIPFERGLDGHSDGDALLHSVTDAVLGAAGLGDIGDYFPDDDPAWKDADSARLLALALQKAYERGYVVGNVDVNVLAERPKLKPHKQAIRESVAGILQLEPDLVSIKAKTREGLGAVGRNEAIEVHCVVLLKSRQRNHPTESS